MATGSYLTPNYSRSQNTETIIVCFKNRAIFIVEYYAIPAMMVSCEAIPDVSADVAGSKVNVLMTAMSVYPQQPSTVKWLKVRLE
ncbi:hypothetical protein TNCV_4046121 [Trichonephila clavipes]|nr:hypothetical protein TNCV_4046121 [Trichonephila clavipes]